MDGRGHHPEEQVLNPLERSEPYSGSCLGRVMFEPRRMEQVPDLVSGSPVRLECGRKIERSLVWNWHGSDLVSSIQENKDIHADTILSAQGMDIPVNSIILISSSPLLSSLLSNSSPDKIILEGVSEKQCRHLVEFMYTGHVGRIQETEIPQLLLLARCLQINGILAALRVPVDCNPQVSPEKTIPTHPDPSSPPAVPPMDEDEEGEDDVFVDDNAEDLSPSNRSPEKTAEPRVVKRLASLNKISEALSRLSSGSKSSVESDCSPVGESDPTPPGESDLDSQPRIKKPRPLTGLPGPEDPATKTKTPRTPLIPSPDCRLIEERFRQFLDSCSAEQQEKLRNLSVSSSDFNFNDCSSLPNTPGYKHKQFNIPEIQMKEEREENPGCLNSNPGESSQIQISSSYSVRIPDPSRLSDSSRLSDPVRKPEFTLISSSSSLAHPGAVASGSEQSSPNNIPVINVIKPEPPDAESFTISVESPEDGSVFPDANSNIKYEAEDSSRLGFYFPAISLPLALPYPQYLLSRLDGQNSLYTREFKSSFISNPHSAFTPTRPDDSQFRSQESAKPKQVFKCQKCGKGYNWNYNLNRHIRFECGIENKFECSMCNKRFPYKQNAAIHLRRKHKVLLETADDMLNAGQIVQLGGKPMQMQ